MRAGSPTGTIIGHMDCHAEVQPDNVKQQPEKQDVERHLERRNGFQHRAVHADDINCVGQSRNHHQNRSRDIERRTIAAFEQQPDTGQCQQDAQRCLRREFSRKPKAMINATKIGYTNSSVEAIPASM